MLHILYQMLDNFLSLADARRGFAPSLLILKRDGINQILVNAIKLPHVLHTISNFAGSNIDLNFRRLRFNSFLFAF